MEANRKRRKIDTLKKQDFIDRLSASNLTPTQAEEAYCAFMSVIEDGIVNAKKIDLGKVGTINPSWHKARAIRMGFEKVKGGKIEKCNREYHLGQRVCFRVKVKQTFIQNTRLNWFS